MSNYIKSTDFAVKDGLVSGNPAKIVSGTEIDDEYNAIQTAVNTKADLNSPTFTGTPSAPTAAQGTSTTQLATCQFVTVSPQFTGTPIAPTASVGTNTTQLATTAYVKAEINSVITGGTGTLDFTTAILNNVYFNGNTSGWRIYQNGTTLYFSYNGTIRAAISSNGQFSCENDVVAFASL